MKPAVHQYEDKLLEFAYGELPQNEADAVNAHVKSCERCSAALASISSVRKTMAQLPAEPAPDAGLDSLLAFAEQHAARSAPVNAPRKRSWMRWAMPLMSVMTLMVVGVVGFRATKIAPMPSSAANIEQESRKSMARAKNEAPAPSSAAAPAGSSEEMAYAEPLGGERLAEQKPAAEAELQYERRAAPPPPPAAVADWSNSGIARDRAKQPERKQRENAQNSNGPVNTKAAPKQQLGKDAYATQAEEQRPMNEADDKSAEYDNIRGQTNDGASVAQAMEGNANKGTFGLGSSSAGRAGTGSGASTGSLKDLLAASEQDMQPRSAPTPGSKAGASKFDSSKFDSSNFDSDSEGSKEAPKTESYKGKVARAEKYAEPAPAPAASAPAPSTPAPVAATPAKPSVSRDEAPQERRADVSTKKRASDDSEFDSLSGGQSVDPRVAAWLKQLRDGAQGQARAEALEGLCSAYESAGRASAGKPYCDALFREFPKSSAARRVEGLRARARQAPAEAE